MTDESLSILSSRLRALTGNVFPEPWTRAGAEVVDARGRWIATAGEDDEDCAAYLAACDPTTLVRLLDALDALDAAGGRAEENRVRTAVNESCTCGGRAPHEGACPACMVWHRWKALAAWRAAVGSP